MLDPGGPLPLYQQMKQALRRILAAGTWAPHTAIPSERELIQRFGVSRITVRQALADLVVEGLLYRRHGSGTFVAPVQSGPIAETLSALTGHVEELQLRGLSPDVALLALEQKPLPAGVAGELERREGTLAWWIRRLVAVDMYPLMLLEVYVPSDLGVSFDPEELKVKAITAILEEFGRVPLRGVQRIAAGRVEEQDAVILGVEAGAAILRVTRVISGRGGVPLEWSQALYRSDRYEYEVELRRNKR